VKRPVVFNRRIEREELREKYRRGQEKERGWEMFSSEGSSGGVETKDIQPNVGFGGLWWDPGTGAVPYCDAYGGAAAPINGAPAYNRSMRDFTSYSCYIWQVGFILVLSYERYLPDERHARESKGELFKRNPYAS
jgi:hypothetical protein